jgi:hypothetical protein
MGRDLCADSSHPQRVRARSTGRAALDQARLPPLRFSTRWRFVGVGQRPHSGGRRRRGDDRLVSEERCELALDVSGPGTATDRMTLRETSPRPGLRPIHVAVRPGTAHGLDRKLVAEPTTALRPRLRGRNVRETGARRRGSSRRKSECIRAQPARRFPSLGRAAQFSPDLLAPAARPFAVRARPRCEPAELLTRRAVELVDHLVHALRRLSPRSYVSDGANDLQTRPHPLGATRGLGHCCSCGRARRGPASRRR